MMEKYRFQFSFSLSSLVPSFLSWLISHLFLYQLLPSLYRPFVLMEGFHSSALQFERLPPQPFPSSSSPELLFHVSWSSPPPPRWSTRMGATRVHRKSLPPPLLGAAASSACWEMSGQECPAQPHQLWLWASILGPLSLVQHNLSRFAQGLQIPALFSPTFFAKL